MYLRRIKINSWYHSKSSAKKWGGDAEDYYDVHAFIDSSKSIIGDVRHRALYHHTAGVFLCERIFGATITTARGIQVPTRLIAEQHILEDLGCLPSPADYINGMPIAPWMSGSVRKTVPLSHLLKGTTTDEAQ